MRHCLNEQIVVCALSSEIAVRFTSEALGKTALNTTDGRWICRVYSHKSQTLPTQRISKGPETAPAKRSIIARWITKCVLRR